jgi:hypothetical protein
MRVMPLLDSLWETLVAFVESVLTSALIDWLLGLVGLS